MIKASMNQKGNVSNPNQGTKVRVLCVCSAGLLRSPTAANVLHKEYGYNTRACGVFAEFALIPISEALVLWADEIVFMEQDHWEHVKDHPAFLGKHITILSVPDDYGYGDSILQSLISEGYANSVGFIHKGAV